jgi:hypothetical protein
MTSGTVPLQSFIRRFITLVVLLTALAFSHCNFKFFLTGWENAVYGTTAVDKDLILWENSLRSDHKSGNLDLTSPDYFKQVNSVKYVVQYQGGDLYICFFGTDNPLDLYYDFVHWKEPAWTDSVDGVRVHAGFYRPYMVDPDGTGPILSPAEDIRNTVSDFLAVGADPHIYLAGHSAGGCHALLCAFDLNLQFPVLDSGNRIRCLIGGAPAVGNDDFAAKFEFRLGSDSCHRYVNGSDQMPSLLTSEAGFYQAGRPYRIGGDPNPVVAATGAWVADHLLSSYADSVRALDPS